ncbi:MAG: hypothetical protein AAGI71_15210 [Bacteroidota bacterium]
MEEPDLPPFIPDYNKPESPGIWMNFDNSVSVYYIVGPEDTFVHAAQTLFALVREAEEQFPGWPRVLYVDVVGHKGDRVGFDSDLFELQQEFIFSVLAPFLTAFEMPLTGPLVNPEPQRNDLPDGLRIE